MITIYHNPRCSKSRKSLDLILSKTKDIKIIEYLKNPPTTEELKTILKKLNIKAIDIVRIKEDEFKVYKDKDPSEDELLNLIIKHPALLERPIVVKANKAVIGRPPENVLSLF